MESIISIRNLTKTYASGLRALNNINLDIRRGEIFALLGPNGAGKTTLISIICGIVTPSTGTVLVDGHDIADFRAARSRIGLVPQELKELDREIKAARKEARQVADLEAKVALHKQTKELERKRNDKRRKLFDAQDEIDERKDELISQIEARLKRRTEENKLFTIRWHVS